MRQKYETLSLAVLRDLAKARGMKRISTLKKAELIERMLQQDELDAQAAKQEEEIQQKDRETSVKIQPGDEKPSDLKAETGQKEIAVSVERSEQEFRKPVHRNMGKSGDTPQRMKNLRDSSQDHGNSRDFSLESREKKESVENGQNHSVRESSNHKPYKNNNYNNRQDDNRYRYSKSAANLSDETGDERIKTVDDRTVQKMESEGISMSDLDSGEQADGILEVMPDGYGFIRCENYLPGDQDVYVSPSQIRRFRLKTGDIIAGNKRIRSQGEKFSALLYISCVNGMNPSVAAQRIPFEDLTPIFPNERLRLETNSSRVSMRIMDLIAPVGKGQRGMIVSQPKAGKTTLLKEIAASVKQNNP
ncbi:MAG: transcription termination factor Rho, partial [Clostridiales bacterium]|nr:transcription termination factor Rho [Clostridiales bacterium]